jgi:hypothetical protein
MKKLFAILATIVLFAGLSVAQTATSCPAGVSTGVPGVTLSPDGTLCGTPTASGTFPFTVQVCDSGSPQQCVSSPEAITIVALLKILTTALPPGTQGLPYPIVPLQAIGGTPPYVFSIVSPPATAK